jgi:hypothetical protein
MHNSEDLSSRADCLLHDDGRPAGRPATGGVTLKQTVFFFEPRAGSMLFSSVS